MRGRDKTHGMCGTPEYRVWDGMHTRCYNSAAQQYKNYGGRGITVCAAWKKSFETFYKDVGPRPSRDYEIDRIHVNGNYEPGNVRWTPRFKGQRRSKYGRIFTMNGRKNRQST